MSKYQEGKSGNSTNQAPRMFSGEELQEELRMMLVKHTEKEILGKELPEVADKVYGTSKV